MAIQIIDGEIYDKYLRAFPVVNAMEETVDAMLAERIKADNYTTIASIGVGGGERIRRIAARTGRELKLIGTDLSTGMLGEARKNGLYAVQHDMSKPLPFRPGSLDAIVWLTGDFGYLMDSVNGQQIRQNALWQAYEALAPGGMFFAEMQMQDRQQHKPGRVRKYRRQLVQDGTIIGEYDFYAKMFRFPELQQLVAGSPFGAENSTLFYMLRYTEDNDGNPDFARSGKIVAVYKGFEGFDLTRIHPDPKNPREFYNGILIARK